jgi:hypothetical protein
MRGWLERWVRRQNELERGVDADLVGAVRRKWKLFLWLFGSGGLTLGCDALFTLRGWLHNSLIFIAALFFIAGTVVARLAWAEDAFLSRPEPEEPPRLFKL